MKLSKLIKLIPCFWLPLLVLLIHLLITVPFGFYTLYGWLDIPMHFVGGASIAYSFILVFKRCKDEIIIKDKLVNIIILLALVGLSAILWEFFEFFAYSTVELYDTLFDMFMGLLGGLLIALFGKVSLKSD